MKQSFLDRITLCECCRKAFIIDEEGDNDTCDSCLAESELTHELIESDGLLTYIHEQMKKDR